MRLPVPGSEIFGSAELRKRKHENKTGGNWEEKGRLSLPFSRPANFSRTFFFRVFPTIWEPGTGYPCANPQLIVVLSFGRLALDLAHTVFSICTFSLIHLVCLPPPPPPTPTKKIAWPLLVLQSPQEKRKTMPVVYYGRRANGEYRAYSHDVCCCPETKKKAMLVLQANPVGVEPFFFCSINLHSHWPRDWKGSIVM